MLSANQSNRLLQLRLDPTTALARGANTSDLVRGDVLYANKQYYVALLDTDGSLQYDNTLGSDSAVPRVQGLTMEKVLSLGDTVFAIHSAEGIEWRAVAAPILADGQPRGTLLI